MLKRVVFLVTLAAFVVALTSFNIASADPKVKTMVCHHNPDVDDGDPEWVVIEVAESAVPAHEAHGDCLDFSAPLLEPGQPCTCTE